MAIPPRQDGRAHHWDQARHWRIDRLGVPARNGRAKYLSRPVGDPDAVVNPLVAHYSRFRVADRILLTGHSHQAWPDVAFEAQQRAWLDAAELVDDKWEKAEEQAAHVRAGFARLLADAPENIALGQNTHELVT